LRTREPASSYLFRRMTEFSWVIFQQFNFDFGFEMLSHIFDGNEEESGENEDNLRLKCEEEEGRLSLAWANVRDLPSRAKNGADRVKILDLSHNKIT